MRVLLNVRFLVHHRKLCQGEACSAAMKLTLSLLTKTERLFRAVVRETSSSIQGKRRSSANLSFFAEQKKRKSDHFLQRN